MSTKNIIIILVIVIILGLGFYMWKNNTKKSKVVEDPNSIQAIDKATKQDTTTAIEQNIQNINLENSDSDFNSIDAEINKL